MALIKNQKQASDSSGSYTRIFNNDKLGSLITKTHATSISSGTELEKLILEKAYKYIVHDWDECKAIFERKYNNKNIFIIPKTVIKKSYLANGVEPDFLVLTVKNNTINIIELKDGWVFDTGKSSAIIRNLKQFQNSISKNVSFKTNIFLCSFSSNDKEQIFKGCKKRIPLEHIMTGSEFCNLININYELIKKERMKHGELNFHYFIEELLLIPEVKAEIIKKISN